MSTENNEQAPAPQEAPRVVQINDEKAVCSYANFCRVSGAPEEMIIDFGLNPQPVGIPTQPINITQRVVMNYYTAKRMFHALQLTLQRHEATFGVIEVDLARRARPQVQQPEAE
ncbi:MAG: DUF3467 domain-containing protein [Thermoguttaceae bacterium]|nr:DUF3467 domain-containing protein [Thermoguttaceae bacterium]MDO4859089.1 DUF3467 domain-containing protein [Thermoguttaceae bacterium]